jgi:hypothetical protein
MKHSAQALFNRHGPYCPDPITDTQKQEREGTASTYDTTPVRTTRIENRNDVSALEAAWTALLNRVPGHSVLETFAWNVWWWNAFRDLGLHAVNTWIVDENPSIRALQRYGFRYIGRLRQRHYVDDKLYDRLMVDLLANEHKDLVARQPQRVEKSRRQAGRKGH